MSKIIDEIVCGINRANSAFNEIKPTLERRILDTTAIIVYHRPPIKEEDKDIESLLGLIFPLKDLNRKIGDKTPKLSNRLAMFDVYKPKNPEVYIGIDMIVENPKEVLVYGLRHLDKAPRKIMKDTIGRFYLTTKPLLSGGNWMYPEVDFYIFSTHLAVCSHDMYKNAKQINQLLEKAIK
jgi:hypothetical protein